MKFNDYREMKIVYLGNCILNQNSRGNGVAVRKGSFTEFIQILLDHEIGIEQLPCPECLIWGGVSRPALYRWQPLLLKSIEKWWWPFLEFFANISTFRNHKNNCKKAANKVVDRMEDFTKEGYTILGVITANDSPTCGVTKTVDLLGTAKNHKELGLSLEELEAWSVDIEANGTIVPKVLVDGSGAFSGAIMKELKKRHLDIKVIGFDPWAEAIPEATKIAGLLGLPL